VPDHFDDLLDRLTGVRRKSDQAEARCPAHDDAKSSLSIGRGEGGRVLITCHAGCRWEDVLRAVDMVPSDAFGAPRLIHEYIYTDAEGRPAYVIERWEPKTFRQRMASGARRAPRAEEKVIYNLPGVRSLEAGRSLFYVEGEKDADTLIARGYCATTTPGGAGKPWLDQYTEALTGYRVVIVADNDVAGRRWARKVADALQPACQTVVVVPPKGIKDVTELVEAGYDISAMAALPDTHGEVAMAADIPIKAVEWLWPGRVPAGMLTLLEGDPGTGKSTVAAELIACLTTGRALPGAAGNGPLRVAMLADEDSWMAVVVPRLQAAGADLSRVIHLKGIRAEDGYLQPYSLMDLPTLRHDVHAVKAQVLIIDPLMAYLGVTLDMHRDQHARSVLGPLVQFAEEDNVSVIAVRHFTKGSVGGKAIYRGGGSIGFTGQARSILQAAEYPNLEDDRGRFVLAVAKCNLAPLAETLGYRIQVDERLNVGRIAWDDEPVQVTASQLSKPEMDMDAYRAGREAVEWLANYVETSWTGEPFEWQPILTAARDAGIAKNTLERHRSKILMLRISGPGGQRAARWVPITPPLPRLPRAPGNGEIGEWDRELLRRIDPSGYDEDRQDSNTDTPAAPSISQFPHFPVLGTDGEMARTEGADLTRCSVCGNTDGVIIDGGRAYCAIHVPLLDEP
jgi:hypothetical protein